MGEFEGICFSICREVSDVRAQNLHDSELQLSCRRLLEMLHFRFPHWARYFSSSPGGNYMTESDWSPNSDGIGRTFQ